MCVLLDLLSPLATLRYHLSLSTAAVCVCTKDELLLKLYNLNEENVKHLIGEITERREQVMQRLYLYEAIRRRHYADPATLPVRHKGVYLALQSGIHQGEQFLSWCDEALELLASVDSASEET